MSLHVMVFGCGKSPFVASKTTSFSVTFTLFEPSFTGKDWSGLSRKLSRNLGSTVAGSFPISPATERASLAGLIGKEPATVDPKFLDSLRDNPDQSFPVKLGSKSVNVTLKDVVFDATKGDFPHPNTMTCKLLAGDKTLFEQEYYSVGGGFIEWKGYT